MTINSEGPKPKGKDLKFRDLGKKPVDNLGHGLGYVGDNIRNTAPVSPADRDAETAVTDEEAQRRLERARMGIARVNIGPIETGGKLDLDEKDGIPR